MEACIEQKTGPKNELTCIYIKTFALLIQKQYVEKSS